MPHVPVLPWETCLSPTLWVHSCPHVCPSQERLEWPRAGSHVQCVVQDIPLAGRGFSENAPSVWLQVLGVPSFPVPSNSGSFCSAQAVQRMMRMKGNVPGLSCARSEGMSCGGCWACGKLSAGCWVLGAAAGSWAAWPEERGLKQSQKQLLLELPSCS